MATASVSRVEGNLTAYTLESPADMLGALQVLVAAGFTGTITTYMNGETLVWRMAIQSPNLEQETMYLYLAIEGHDPAMTTVAVFDGALDFSVWTDADFAAKFTINS